MQENRWLTFVSYEILMILELGQSEFYMYFTYTGIRIFPCMFFFLVVTLIVSDTLC